MNKFLDLAKDFLEKKVCREQWYQDIKAYLKAVILYGSVAKGTNRPDSDIDLLFILPIEIEKKYTKGEYFLNYKNNEFNIVVRSIERLREIAKSENDSFQAEIFRDSVIVWEKDEEVRNLIGKIGKILNN